MDLFGGASRDRTDDLIVANDALSQLSYSPTYQEGAVDEDCSSRITTRERRRKLTRTACGIPAAHEFVPSG